jgi:CheY-like chemotaxis protein
VLLNLLGNAVKFTERGWIKVEVDVVGGPEFRSGPIVLEFRVIDTGIGIPKDRQELFQSYAQAAALPGRFGGTGLGLTISSQLARLMGGGLTFDSEAGKGSIFTFRAKFELAALDRDASTNEPLAGRRALIVDSSVVARDVIRIHLESWGLSVAQADSAREALAILERSRETPFHFAVIDRFPPDLDGKELAARIKNELGIHSVRLVLVTPPGRSEKSSALVRAGFDAWITKPVNDRKLRTALLHASDELISSVRPALPAPASASSGSPPRPNVLVVEDNLVNQRVTALMLRRMGFGVTCANDGRAAVEAVAKTRFAAILMDCQMPLMNGFEATEKIRESPGGTVPIIAMTAAAMNKDRELCLEAGMNDYLSKPVQKAELERMLEKWILPESLAEVGVSSEEPMYNDKPILDQGVIASLRELGGPDDPGLFVELVNLFLSDTPERMRTLSEAFERRDPSALEHAAHALKSSSANLGALGLSGLFRDIEAAGREKDLERARPLVERTRPEFERVQAALRSELN